MTAKPLAKPELLAPAGSMQHLRYAFAYGADAVYAGLPRYSLRVRNNEFTLERLAQGINIAHQSGRSFFVVSNIYPHNSKVKTFMRDMAEVIALRPDALIISDPGLIMMVREKWPDMPLHLSVQANTLNWATVRFWQEAGISRIILSRELSLDEIAEIRQRCPDIELEVFIHGALCVAYSGRCLLSGYINRRDPNQGACTNACRWKYQAHEASQTWAGDVVPREPALGLGEPSDALFLLQEEGRPESGMPAFEDEHGTYVMNSKDLRAVQHVARLCEMGIDCFKIEGRTKSYYYVTRTVQAYRQAIDDAVAGRGFDMGLMDSLEGLASRGYTEGFYRRHVHDEYQNYEQGHSTATRQQFVGEIVDHDGEWLTIEVKNRFQVGDTMELITPSGNHRFSLQQMEKIDGSATDCAPGSGHVVRIPLAGVSDLKYALLARDSSDASE